MVVPESPNNQPELPNQKGAEAQAAANLQQDTRFDSINSGDFDAAFNMKNDSSTNALLGDLALDASPSDKAISGDATAANSVVNAALKDGAGATDPRVREALDTYKQIAAISTIDTFEQALSVQKDTIRALENRVSGQQKVGELGDEQAQANKLLEANTYLANFT